MILRSMRNGFLSAFFLGLLVLGGISLVFTDWNGMFKGGFNKTDVAKVDGTPIKIAEFNNRVNHIIRQQQIDAATAYQIGLVDNILRQEIFEILLKKDANHLGIRIPDRIVADQIKEMIAPLKKDAVSDKDALKKFLETQGMNEKQLATALRDDLTSKILKSTISSGTYIPKALTENILAYKNESRKLDVAFYPNSAITIKDQPKDADLEKYYLGMTASFMVPEHRDVTVAILDTSKIAKPKITDADVKAAYEDNKDNYMLPEKAELEQALLSDEAKAKAIADAVKSGKAFKDAVIAATGNDKAFQGKNTYSKDGLPTDISTPVFAAKSGDVIGPIKSPLGFHVIKLVKLDAAAPASFDSVKDKIRKDIEDEKSGDALFTVTSQIEDRLAGGEHYEDMKGDVPLTIIPLKNLTADSKAGAELAIAGKDADTIMTKAFMVGQDAPSELSDIGERLMFSVRLDKLTPATPKAFASVKAEVLKKWVADNQSQENLLAAQKLVDDLNADKAKIDAKKIQSVTLSRSGSSGVAKDVTERFMSADKGKFVMAISKEKDGVYIGRVTDIALAKTDDKKEADTKKQLESDLASSSYMGYLGSLQNQYSVTINDGLLKRAYGPSKDSQ